MPAGEHNCARFWGTSGGNSSSVYAVSMPRVMLNFDHYRDRLGAVLMAVGLISGCGAYLRLAGIAVCC